MTAAPTKELHLTTLASKFLNLHWSVWPFLSLLLHLLVVRLLQWAFCLPLHSLRLLWQKSWITFHPDPTDSLKFSSYLKFSSLHSAMSSTVNRIHLPETQPLAWLLRSCSLAQLSFPFHGSPLLDLLPQPTLSILGLLNKHSTFGPLFLFSWLALSLRNETITEAISSLGPPYLLSWLQQSIIHLFL